MKADLICIVKVLFASICLRQDTDGEATGHGIMVSPELLLFHANVSWEEAFSICLKASSTLTVPKSRDEVNAVHKMLGINEHLWIGQYTYNTQWMYATGCYRYNSSQCTNIKDNDVVTCESICDQSDIMLGMYKCACVDEAPDEATQEKIGECDITCNSTDCGENAYLHYTKYTNIKQESPGNNCGMYEHQYYTNDVHILARNCEAMYPSLCMLYDATTKKTWLYPLRDDNGTILQLSYVEAEEACTAKGSVLADPTKLHEIAWKPGDPVLYWIGARARTKYVQSVKVLPTSKSSQMCLYMTVFSSWVSTNRRKDCYSPSSFLCRKRKALLTNQEKHTHLIITVVVLTVVSVLTVSVIIFIRLKKVRHSLTVRHQQLIELHEY